MQESNHMAAQAVPGEAILENVQSTREETPVQLVEALVAEHSLMAFRIAYSILRNHHDAEDAAQECFLRILKHARRLHQVRSPKTWVARVAWTTALDRRSSRARTAANETVEEPLVLAQIAAGNPAADAQLAEKQLQGLLAQMIAALPEDLRQPLELATVQELNSAEIAEIMNIPEGSVRTRLMRARQRLKEKLSAVLEAKHG